MPQESSQGKAQASQSRHQQATTSGVVIASLEPVDRTVSMSAEAVGPGVATAFGESQLRKGLSGL